MSMATAEAEGLLLYTPEALTQSAFICVTGAAIVIANLLIIASYLNFRGLGNEVIDYYILSLSAADLLCGLLVVPLSAYPAAVGHWPYGDILCRLAGYLEVTLWSISVYTFMWISVDRYLAVRKPLRYETVQTRTRCQCWMVFTWVSASMLCCPPLLGFNKPLYHADSHICMLDWGNMFAYSVTLAILVLGPSVISIVHNYLYIFSMMRRVKSGAPVHDKEYAAALAESLANPSHVTSFALVAIFWISWAPYAGVRFYEFWAGAEIRSPLVLFAVVWAGILNSFWKVIILSAFSPRFGLALRLLCLTVCCRSKARARAQAELAGLEDD